MISLVCPGCSAGELFTLKQVLVNYYLEKAIFSKIGHIEAESAACGFGCNIGGRVLLLCSLNEEM